MSIFIIYKSTNWWCGVMKWQKLLLSGEFLLSLSRSYEMNVCKLLGKWKHLLSEQQSEKKGSCGFFFCFIINKFSFFRWHIVQILPTNTYTYIKWKKICMKACVCIVVPYYYSISFQVKQRRNSITVVNWGMEKRRLKGNKKILYRIIFDSR